MVTSAFLLSILSNIHHRKPFRFFATLSLHHPVRLLCLFVAMFSPLLCYFVALPLPSLSTLFFIRPIRAISG